LVAVDASIPAPGARLRVRLRKGFWGAPISSAARFARRRLVGAVMSDRLNLVLALFEPDIAANTGAMLRTAACFGADAALIEPAGFVFSDRRFRRAGMDYLDALQLERHASFAAFEDWRRRAGRRLTLLTTGGDLDLWDFQFQPGDVVMVGRESAGASPAAHEAADARLKIPIRPPLRSLNVGVAAGIALAEAARQLTRR
jgi:tRNA (cytidine/uridine-2'-O-)-methyltransferase